MKTNHHNPIALVVVLIAACGTVSAQTTRNVPSASYPTIQSALNASLSGDTVLVAAGTYVENVVFPGVDVQLIGAGPGQSIIDGNQTGSCLAFNWAVTNAAIVEGFTLTNGSGTIVGLSDGNLPAGGAIFMLNLSSPLVMAPVFRKLEIIGNSAYDGGAVYARSAYVTFEDCSFSANVATATFAAPTSCALFHNNYTVTTFRRCTFSQHGSAHVVKFDPSWNPTVVIEDCEFFNNTTSSPTVSISGTSIDIRRTIFHGNVCDLTLHVLASSNTPPLAPSTVDSCKFFGNSCSYAVVGVSGSTNRIASLSGLNICNNVVTGPGAALSWNGAVDVANTIIRWNVDANGLSLGPGVVHATSFGAIALQDSNIQGMSGAGPGVVDVDPLFVDPMNDDYRLAPGSPMIDAGTVNPSYPLGPTDVAGQPRLRGLAVDIGAHEAQSPGHSQYSMGRVGDGAGGPFEVFTINGSTGGVLRRITAPVGSSATMAMLQPPNVAGPCHFSIFGIIGEASFDTELFVPLGIDDMVFAPAPLAPYLQPLLFTLASSVGPIQGVAPLFQATPTPWVSGLGPAIPFPLTMTLQGVIEEAPGVFTPTNAIAYIVE